MPNHRWMAGAIALSAAVLILFLVAALPCAAGWEQNPVDQSLPQYPTVVSIGDADNDGKSEVVAGGDGFGLRIYRGTRSRWSYEEVVGQLQVTDAAIGDADNDGKNEIICGTAGRMVLLYEHNGIEWTVKNVERRAASPIASISCGDADSDGKQEIVAGLSNGRITIYELLGGVWIRATVDSGDGHSVTSTFIGDADNDAAPELVVGTEDKSVFLYKREHGAWKRTTVDANAAPGVASVEIGDCDSDGKSEIVAGTSGKKIFAYEWDGDSWTKECVDNNAGGFVSGTAISDLDGDGWNELVAIAGAKRRRDSKILIYERAPAEWYKEEVNIEGSGDGSALSVGDPDNDGDAEFVVGVIGARSVFVFDEFRIRHVVWKLEDETIAITWESDPGDAFYVYYSEDPYGGYRYASSVRATRDSVTWVDDGTAIPVHPRNVKARYYTVRKVEPDVVSNTVGKFTRTFRTEMHLTSLPLVPYSNWIQDLIGTQLTGAKGEGYADRVWKWEPARMQFQFAWLVDGVGPEYDGRWWCTRPFGPSPMTLDFGEGFFVQSHNGEQDVTFVGALPAGVIRVGPIRSGLQMIGAPHAEPVVLDSTDLYESGAKGAPSEVGADRIWRWDEEELRYRYVWLVDETGTEYDGTWWDSEIWGKATTPMAPGYGYWYQARGDNFFWTFLN